MFSILNYILTTFALPGLVFCFGLCFCFIMVPDYKGLHGYRMARRMMGWAYFLYFIALVARAIGVQIDIPPVLQQMHTIVIGIGQAFFFTFALTTLIDVQFFTWRRFVRELLTITLPVIAVSIAYGTIHFESRLTYQIPFLLITLFYLCKLVNYVIVFRRSYHDYEQRMEEYFSDNDRQRLQWVNRSFYTALGIGVFALLYSLFPSTYTSLLFTLTVMVYYAYFGIRFINYAFTFHQIEAALSEQLPAAPASTADTSYNHAPIIDEQLMARLDAMMTERHLYAKPDLTIEEVAVMAGESYRSVSSVINNSCNTNFKGWVNAFRVEEAERLMDEGYLKEHTIDALASTVGFANRISFYRVFKKHTGMSPADYR